MIYHLHQKNPARASEFALTEDYIVVSKMYLIIKINKSKEIIFRKNMISSSGQQGQESIVHLK